MTLLEHIESIAQRAEHAASQEAQALWTAIKSECAHLMAAQPSTAPTSSAPTQPAGDVLARLDQLEKNLMSSMENLQAELAQLKAVTAQAVTIINGFPDKMAAAVAAAKSGDDAAVDAATAELTDSVNSLNAAVAAASPAPAPAPEPAPDPAPATPDSTPAPTPAS